MLPIAKCMLSAISELPGLALQIRTDALQKGQKKSGIFDVKNTSGNTENVLLF